jgi:5'-nucleotidase
MTTATKTPKQLTIAVDLDNTSAEYTHGLRSKVGKLLGISPADFQTAFPVVTDYAMWNNGWTGMDTKEKYFALHTQAVEDGLFEDLVPYDGVSKTLWKFHSQGHFIRIVTARFLKPGDRYTVMETTSKFLDAHDIPVDDIAFTARKVEVMADVYIDDSPSNIKNLTAAGRTVIIYHQEYNKDLDGLRAHNWEDVERIINELAAA